MKLKFFLFGMQISAKTVVLHKIFSPKNCTIPRFGPVKRNIIPNDIITVISFLGKMCFKMKWLFFAKMKIPLMSFLSGAAAYYTLLDFESLPVKCTLKKKYWVYSRLNPIRTEWNIKKSFFYKYLDMYYGFFVHNAAWKHDSTLQMLSKFFQVTLNLMAQICCSTRHPVDDFLLDV